MSPKCSRCRVKAAIVSDYNFRLPLVAFMGPKLVLLKTQDLLSVNVIQSDNSLQGWLYPVSRQARAKIKQPQTTLHV